MASRGARQPETLMSLPDGAALTLRRHPTRRQPAELRAWDAADLLLLRHLAGQASDLLPDEGVPQTAQIGAGPIVVATDGFGAITTALAAQHTEVIHWSDDIVAQQVARANLAANGVDPDAISWLPATETPERVGALLVKIPRTRSLLADMLTRVRPALADDALVVATGMTRHVHTASIDAFTELIGPTVSTKAWKKARLLLSSVQAPVVDRDGPLTYEVEGLTAVGLPGVFSRRKLDRGTAALLEHLPPAAVARPEVIDLGCGNGIVGTAFAAQSPGARLTFIDSSYLAVASAQMTFERAHPDSTAGYQVADGLDGTPDGSADMILCNPPFHQDNVIGDDIAWRMFTGAHRVLRSGGQLIVVGNRHLGHHARLGKIFGASRVLSSDPSFVVVAASRA